MKGDIIVEENRMPVADEMLNEAAGGGIRSYKYDVLYTVKENDTLGMIARHFEVFPSEIINWNREKIRNPNHLEAGMELIIHTNVPQ